MPRPCDRAPKFPLTSKASFYRKAGATPAAANGLASSVGPGSKSRAKAYRGPSGSWESRRSPWRHIAKVALCERERSGARKAIGSLSGFIVPVESREIQPEESLRVGKGAAGLRSRCWDTRRGIGPDERVNATTTDSEGRNRDTEEPGAGNLLARICGGAGEATPRLYPGIYNKDGCRDCNKQNL